MSQATREAPRVDSSRPFDGARHISQPGAVSTRDSPGDRHGSTLDTVQALLDDECVPYGRVGDDVAPASGAGDVAPVAAGAPGGAQANLHEEAQLLFRRRADQPQVERGSVSSVLQDGAGSPAVVRAVTHLAAAMSYRANAPSASSPWLAGA